MPFRRGVDHWKIPYKISKSWDFAENFRISGKISRFHGDFKISLKISKSHNFRISRKIMQDFLQWRFLQDFSDDSARFPDSSADFDIDYWFSISGWCDYLLQKCCVQAGIYIHLHTIFCISVIQCTSRSCIYMHAWRLTTDNYKLRELTTNYTLASHTLSAKSVASESTYIIGIYNIYFYVQQLQ